MTTRPPVPLPYSYEIIARHGCYSLGFVPRVTHATEFGAFRSFHKAELGDHWYEEAILNLAEALWWRCPGGLTRNFDRDVPLIDCSLVSSSWDVYMKACSDFVPSVALNVPVVRALLEDPRSAFLSEFLLAQFGIIHDSRCGEYYDGDLTRLFSVLSSLKDGHLSDMSSGTSAWLPLRVELAPGIGGGRGIQISGNTIRESMEAWECR